VGGTIGLLVAVLVVAGLIPAATRAEVPFVPPDPCDELFGGTPVNTNAPVLSGDPAVGEVLTTSSGAWIVCSDPVTHYTYRWLREGIPIAEATASSYTVAFADAERELRAEVKPGMSTAAGQPFQMLSESSKSHRRPNRPRRRSSPTKNLSSRPTRIPPTATTRTPPTRRADSASLVWPSL
jgi:hypothetical protein